MSEHVTIEISKPVYDQVKKLADANRQPIEAFLIETLNLEQTSGKRLGDDAADFNRMQIEKEAFLHMHADLLQAYENQFVAIFNGELIDHDEDELELFKRLNKTHPNDVVLMKKVEREPERILYFRSNRLIRDK